jgi:hypothetical protein
MEVVCGSWKKTPWAMKIGAASGFPATATATFPAASASTWTCKWFSSWPNVSNVPDVMPMPSIVTPGSTSVRHCTA